MPKKQKKCYHNYIGIVVGLNILIDNLYSATASIVQIYDLALSTKKLGMPDTEILKKSIRLRENALASK